MVRHFGEIENGKLYIYDRDGFGKRIFDCPNQKVIIEVHTRSGTISHQLRKYYFGVLLKEAQIAFWNAGYEYDLDTIDHTFRMKALYKDVFDDEQQRYRKEPHTLKDSETEVTMKQFIYFIEYIIRFLAINLDYVASYPNEILGPKDLTEKQLNSLISKR